MNEEVIYSLLFVNFYLIASFSKKTDGVGNGKLIMNQSEALKTLTEPQVVDEIVENGKGKLKKEKLKKNKIKKENSEGLKGIEKQKQKKAEQVQKEIGKGSEKGQESREQRKKWWKFWE